MQRRLAAPLLLLFCTALTIVLLPYPASARVLGLFPSGSPSFSISHLGGPNAGSELPGTEWVTTTAGSGLDLSKIERMRQGNPKMGTSLNLLYDAYRDGGRSGAQQFAYQHLMVADGRRVQVEVTADVDAMAAIREAIEALGGEYQGHHKTLLQAMVPFEALGALAGQPQVWFVRQPLRAMPEEPSAVGAETSEGVDASNASAWHAAGYDGSGVKVAVVDSGFEGYAALLGTELPASVQTRDYTGEGMGGSEHGAGCAEIVHDMAPGADMYLYKVSTMVELSRAVDDLIAENVEIISMSLGWPIDGPGDGTGYLADIVNRARTNGIVFVKSAGNEAERSWSGRYQDSGNNTHRWSQQADVNAFGPEPGRCYHVDEGDQIRFALHWDDWTYVNQDYDLYLVRWTGSGWEVVQASTAYQDGRPGQEPTEMINILAPSEACYGAVVHRASATRDVCLRLSAKDSDGNPLVYTVPSRSLSFPGDSPDAFTVGAVDVISPPAYPLEPYSSQGPTFGPGGACTGGALKPDIAAYARVSTDSYGPTGFAGTSAACPHVAGSSALVKQANPLYTVSDLQNFLEGRAIDQGPAGKDSMYGAGRLHLGPPPEAGTPTPTRTATPTRTGTPTRTPTPTETRPGMVWRTYLPVLLKDFFSAPPPVTATPTPSPTVPSGECVTILREDFEGPFPGPWDVGDLEPGEGEYYWSRSECRPYEGLYSGWAVGGGVDGASLPCGSDYPNNVDSEMTYGPFSLADAGAADLSLRIWLNAPWDNEQLFWGATDGQRYAFSSRFGQTDGWIEQTLDLSSLAGLPRVWVTIGFISDRYGTRPEGAYVDNIVLRKCPSAPVPPTQTPTATPTEDPNDTIIGQSAVLLEGTSALVRSEETNLGNLICDAMLWKTAGEETGICVMNGGGIRASIPPGDVTMGQVLEVLPFGNRISTFGLRGADAWAALENAVSRYEATDGRFAQVGGLRYVFDPSLEVGSRIVSVHVKNGDGTFEPINLDQVYKLASNDFLRGGGDGYTMFADNAIDPYDGGAVLTDAVAEYIGAHSPVSPVVEGRITNTRRGQATATPTATRTRTPTATPTQPVTDWTTIVSEDFEGPFPGDWLLVDNRPGYGEYGWGKRDCRPYGGAYSGWAVGAGAQGSQLSCGSNYPDHAESWMVYGPFSLVDATAAELAFKLWLNTELDHDYIGYYASINGQNFYGWYRGGRDQQWDDAIFDLRDVYVLGDVTGQPEVWVALVFGSDDGRHFPEGCYVDDIVLRKCTSAQCAGGGGVVESQAGVTALGRAKRLRMPLPLAAQAMPPPSREAGDPQ